MNAARPRGFARAGVPATLAAAALFGAGTPAAKLLLGGISPWMLAAILYLGAGLGLTLLRLVTQRRGLGWPAGQGAWLVGAILFGGIVAPVLLMFGLRHVSGSASSLLLNAEGVLTALIAWFVFRENFDRRIAFGMGAIVAGAIVLAWPRDEVAAGWLPSLAIVGACLCWAIDNNLTRKVSTMDAPTLAAMKGVVAGSANLAIAVGLGAEAPSATAAGVAMAVGFLAYGVSLVLFVVGLRNLGTARAGAYFSVAPFFGSVLSLMLLDEPITPPLVVAGTLMTIGVWLHLTERHEHEHAHEAEEHEHEHVHDGDVHHAHEHEPPVPRGTKHSHRHRHDPLSHVHEHVPDAHHRHVH